MKDHKELQVIAQDVYALLKQRGVTIGDVEKIFGLVINMRQAMPTARALYNQREELPLE